MEFSEYVKDKRIVLVGPSPSILGRGNGPFYENNDIIVRMNKAVPASPKHSEDIGSRTDILYNCLEPSPNSGGAINPVFWKEHGVQWVISSYPYLNFSQHNIDHFERKNANNAKLPFRMVEMDLYKKLAQKTKTRPNTGLLAICDLLSFPIKSLLVTGMTFGKDGYYKEYNDMSLDRYLKMANGSNHQQYPQFEYFCDLVKEDERLIPDVVLKEMIYPCKKQ